MTLPDRPMFRAAAWLLLGLGLQALLILNPGYFSHDELQWAARADVPRIIDLPWVAWSDVRAFQYRPLTFNLWLLASHALFARPMAFHALIVLLGSLNGAALFLLLRRLGVSSRVAAVAALVNLLGPYSAYVHGWVATLADLLWVGLALAVAHVAVRVASQRRADIASLLATVALTLLALLAKEAALAIPALLLLAWWLAGRPRVLGALCLASALPAVVYLCLRLSVLLFLPRDPGVYTWSLASVPHRWIEYFLFPWQPSSFEVLNTLRASTKHLAISALFACGLVVATWRARRTAGIVLLVGGTLALAPVLLLDASSNQYGYGFSMVLAGSLAWAWDRFGRGGRILALLFAVIAVWHGVNVQRELRHVGDRQAVYSPALAAAVANAGHPLRVRLPVKDDWIYRRLSFNIPSYRGVEIGERVLLVAPEAPADVAIADDGSLRPVGSR